MKLTSKTYYTPQNTYLSNSKVQLFLKSKEAYKRTYIDRTEPPVDSSSIRIGSMVDWAFEKGRVDAIDEEFQVKVLKREDPELFEKQKQMDGSEFVTPGEKQKAKEIAGKIINSDLYKWYKQKGMRRYFQKIVKDDKDEVCGMIDVLTVDSKNKVCYIDDLKTSAVNDMKDAVSWHWKCLKCGYFMQMALYRKLVLDIYPDYEIVCRHIVVGTSDYYPVKLYILTDDVLKGQYELFMHFVDAIRKEKVWRDWIPTWEYAEELSNND